MEQETAGSSSGPYRPRPTNHNHHRPRGGHQRNYNPHHNYHYRRNFENDPAYPRNQPQANVSYSSNEFFGPVQGACSNEQSESNPQNEFRDHSPNLNDPACQAQLSLNDASSATLSSRPAEGRNLFGQTSRGRGRGRRVNLRDHVGRQSDENISPDDLNSCQPDGHFVRPTQPSQRRPRGRTVNSRYFNDRRKPAEHQQFSSDQNRQNLLGESSTPPEAHDESKIQSEIVEKQLRTNSFECMICCDNIHRSSSIWHCGKCYNIFHLKCAIEWCNKSINSRNEAIASAQYPSLGQAEQPIGSGSAALWPDTAPSQGNNQTDRTVEWPCPACREVLFARPGKYKCFCGKVTRPENNKHLTPHSCGQLCGRKRPESYCPHTCNSVCHPGRCSACPLTSIRHCYCGKLAKDIKCYLGNFSCEQTCGKVLACGKHTCQKICHEGQCDICEEILTIVCYCGFEERVEKCVEWNLGAKPGKKSFSCGNTCNKPLDCGRHKCPEVCHAGDKCRSCKLLSENIKSCPCGSTSIKKALLAQRESCTDPIPTCENKCNRLLPCGPEKNHHRCRKKCHTGSCPPCKLKTIAHCDCKLSTKTIECALMFEKVIEADNQVSFKQASYSFSCESRCNKLKNCGRHRCNNKCCKYVKTQDESLHKCSQICNKKLSCGQHQCREICHPGQCGDCANIGWEELACHCGATVLYPPIPCGARRPTCHRPCRRAHPCGHPVKHECHDDNEKCAPCIVFVKKSCFCGSESKDSVYCYMSGYSCGKTCRKQLACGQHYCQRVCHDNDCETPDANGIILCNQLCPVLRYSCKHPCGLSCHGKTPCQFTECKKIIEISCECGNKVEKLECYKVRRDVENKNMMAMLSSNRPNQESIIIDLSKSKPKAQESSAQSYRKLDCDESCSVLKRNKALAEALEIANPDLKPTNIFGEDPLRLLREAVAQDYKFVAATFNSLSKFIKTAKEAEKRFTFMQFPPANKLRREVIHELAYHFNCTSESLGDEPFKHVTVRAYKNKSTVPDFTIEQLLPVSE